MTIHNCGTVPAGSQNVSLEHLWIIAVKRNTCQMQTPFPSYQKVPLNISSVSNAMTAIISSQSTPDTGTQELF